MAKPCTEAGLGLVPAKADRAWAEGTIVSPTTLLYQLPNFAPLRCGTETGVSKSEDNL